MRNAARALLLGAALALAPAAGAAPVIETVAGGGNDPRDDISPLLTSITKPGFAQHGLTAIGPVNAFDGPAEWVFTDGTGCRVRRVVGPLVVLAAGNLTCGGGFPFTSATPSNVPLRNPGGLSRAADGSLYIADTENGMVHRWIDGLVLTVAGDGLLGGSGAGQCNYNAPYPSGAEPRATDFCVIYDVSGHPSDPNRFLFLEFRTFASGGNIVYLVDDDGAGDGDPNDLVVNRVAGGGCSKTPSVPAEQCLSGWAALAWDHAGTGFVVANQAASTLDHFSSTTFATSTHTVLAGAAGLAGSSGDGGPATGGRLSSPWDVVAHRDGSYLVAENATCRIRRVVPGGNISHFAGITRIGPADCPGDTQPGPADATGIAFPTGVASFADGVLITSSDGRVRKVDRTSILTGPEKITSNPVATFTFDGTDLTADFHCRLDPQPNVIQLLPPCGDAPTDDKSHTETLAGDGSQDGEHLMQIWDAGNNSNNLQYEPDKEEWRWTLDTQPPPAFGLVEPADGADGLLPRPTLTWEKPKDATTQVADYDVLIDGNVSAGEGECGITTCSGAPGSDLPEGTHTWQVRATDQAGNSRLSPVRSMKVGTPPTATLTAAPNPVLVGRPVTFDARGSADANGSLSKVAWDLDNDGVFELETGTTLTLERSYDAAGSYPVSVRVTDGVGLTATASTTLQVANPPIPASQLGVTVNNGAQYTNDKEVKVNLKFPASTTQVLVSNDGGFLAPRTFSPAAEIAWTLDSTGPERLPKTVYVRFLLGGIVSETFTDDIILDERPPVVSEAALAGGAGASAAARRSYRLRVRASDSNSGVAGVQVTANKRKPGALLRYRRTMTVRSSARPRYLRARDRAGNNSRWRTLR